MDEQLNGLVLRYEYRDTDGTGELWTRARYGDFAGASTAWFSDDELLRFAEQLLTHPLGEAQFTIAGGVGTDEAFQEHVGLTVARGLRGQVGVTVHLATPTDRHSNLGSSRSEARVEVLTSYGDLQRFSTELKHLVAGTADEARLDAVVPGSS